MTTPQQPVSGQISDHDAPGGRAWATGIARFAGVVMILLGIVDIVVGRRELSEFDQVIKDWQANGGEQIRKEYQESIAGAA